MKKKLAALWLDYVNNFLTVKRFAEYYNMSEEKACRIIAIGKKLHHQNLFNHLKK